MAALLAAALIGLAPAVPAPQTRCAVDDPRLAELSGLAVSGTDVWAMADGGRRVAVHRLDPDRCTVVATRTATVDPYDAEDLAVAPDGTLWVADTGDNDRRRTTVAVVVVPVPESGRQEPARLHRLTYPDGPHDAEALLLGADGVPTIVTKEVGAAGVYRPEGPLTGPGPTPLVHVDDIVLPSSDTVGGPVGGLGSRTVTGGATTVDGRVVALRTYTDAWLFPAPDQDVVAALRRSPVRVPLPAEPQGEAIAFTPDGTLLSGSESRGGVAGQLRAVPGAAALAVEAAPSTPAPSSGPAAAGPPPTTAAAPDGAAEGSPWRTAALGAGAVVVLLGLLAAGMARHARRR